MGSQARSWNEMASVELQDIQAEIVTLSMETASTLTSAGVREQQNPKAALRQAAHSLNGTRIRRLTIVQAAILVEQHTLAGARNCPVIDKQTRQQR